MIDLYKCFLLFITLLQVMCIANRRCSDLNSTEHRIAIAFYGLSRNLKSTLPSIERHVFEVLDNNSIVYDVFWSSLDAAHVSNKRSGEKNLKLDEADFTLMRPCVISLVSQSVVAPIELILYKQARIGLPANEMDMFNDNLNSVQNLLAAFHSMRIASSMIAKYSKLNNITYDAVVVLRPDTAVITDIDLSQHLNEIIEQNRKYESEIENNSYPQPIWIPDFQHWEGYNDRAAYGSVRVMSRYMMRGIMFRDYVGVGRRFYPNGENYLKAYLHAYNITFQPSTLRVVRVRADESISHGDTLQKFMNMDNSTYASFVARCINNAHIHGPKFFNATNC